MRSLEEKQAIIAWLITGAVLVPLLVVAIVFRPPEQYVAPVQCDCPSKCVEYRAGRFVQRRIVITHTQECLNAAR